MYFLAADLLEKLFAEDAPVDELPNDFAEPGTLLVLLFELLLFELLLFDLDEPNNPLLLLLEKDFALLLKDFENDRPPPKDLAPLAYIPAVEVNTNTKMSNMANTLFFTNIPRIFLNLSV